MRERDELLATAPRGPSAIFILDAQDFVRALASRRRYVSLRREPLDTEEAIRVAIAVDGWCWLEPTEAA